ncbi:S9 family peptidase [Aliikangiella sp. G2MR2-5]|uniref:alpha/beta hydrolase family protein n=1 Tax=Aliikangiella sp. G2MR2-5 TaxID=2788943 RepID=UPI0018AA1CD5|nr:prolyl oligopeptidase family serine peptidase [Aliikangiella sp. G2MR2-5]
MKKYLLFFYLFILPLSLVQAKEIPIENFVKEAQFKDAKLSPEGDYLAVSLPLIDRTGLVILDRQTMKPSYVYRFPENNHVDEFYWVNNERLVFTRVFKEPWREQPVTNGQIYAGNYDGSKGDVIFGWSAGTNRTGNLRMKKNKGPDRSFGEVLHILPDDPEHIIISARHMDHDYDSPLRILKLNVYTGKKKLITRTPYGNMHINLDSAGNPVFANGTDSKGKFRSFFYVDREWIEIKEDEPLNDYRPVASDSSGKKLYMKSHLQDKTDALFEYDMASKKIKMIFNHPESDIHSLIREPSTQIVVGAEVMPDYFEYHYFEPDNEFAQIHNSLAGVFAGEDITITSRTNDLSEMIVLVQSDKNPGDFYLYNHKKKQVGLMLKRKQWLASQDLADRQPIKFKARDGKTIYGYLTLPKEISKPVPLVTYVHGGPYGMQDTWFYDTDAQLLANRGFAVLQVNYRGSGGYGWEYEKIAYKKRHSLIQQDIIDGTKWALSQPEISDKACIMGWSFGGYSALMSPLIEQDLFSCSIAAAGVYDAVLQEEEADYSEISSVALGAAAKRYGTDEKLLTEESPLTYIDKLRTPILIVHGGKDKRVPPEQAYLLKEALDKRNMEYEWLFKEKEGHGFYKEENQIEFYEKAIKFLNKYLK